MEKIFNIVLVAGFLFVDFLMFHDIFKAGEVHTLPEYITGALSIIVIILSVKSLVKK
jgi:hypothetical protein